jgi:predicted secreted protein
LFRIVFAHIHFYIHPVASFHLSTQVEFNQKENTMDATDIYLKTALGTQEVVSKNLDLPHRLRCGLILVDGRHSAVDLQKEAKKLGAPEDFIEQLLARNLIEKKDVALADLRLKSKAALSTGSSVPPKPGVNVGSGEEYARFRAAKDFMTTTIVDSVGVRSFFFTLKMEKSSTLADLKALMPDYGKAMGKSMGDDVAQVMLDRLESMLA